MFKLMVSGNCGMSYSEERTVDDVSLLDAQCKELDEQLYRWTVEDEEGNIVRACRIHTRMITIIERLNAKD